MPLIKMSFYGAVLIALILLLRPLVKRFLPKRTLVFMWWVALIRLLIPFDIPFRFSAYSGASSVFISRGASFDDILSQGAAPLLPTGVSAVSGISEPVQGSLANAAANWALPAIYFAGLLLTLGFFAFSYFKLLGKVRGAYEVTDENILDALVSRRRVRVLSCDNISSPFTFGLLRPVIALPAAILPREADEIRPILLHEMIHIRRFDAPLKILVIIAACVHWFNPFCWIMAFVYARDVELACDWEVVRELGSVYRSGYASMLLSLQSCETISPLTGGFSRLAIRERIMSIMKYRRISVAATALAAALVLLVTAAFATSPEEIAQAASEIASAWPYHAYNEQVGYDDFHPLSFDVSDNGQILISGYTDTGKGRMGMLMTCDWDANSDWDKLEISRDSIDLESYTLNDSEYVDAKFVDGDTIAVLRAIRWADDYHYSAMLVKNDLDIMKADCISTTERGIYPVADGLLINGNPDEQTVRITKMDMSGSILWQILLAEPITFNGIITRGATHMAYGRNGDNCVVIAFDEQGKTLWRYDDTILTEFTDAVLTDDGNMVLVGYDLSRTGKAAVSAIMSVDKSGNRLFSYGYNYQQSDAVFGSIAKTPDGGYMASINDSAAYTVRLVTYDSQGVIINERDMSTSGLILRDNTDMRADGVRLINIAGDVFAIFYGEANYDNWLGNVAYVTVLTQVIPEIAK